MLFAHGSGSGRHSPRNRFVAGRLRRGRAWPPCSSTCSPRRRSRWTSYTDHLRFDIGLLAGRLVAATDWLRADPRTAGLPVGYFGASTGGGAALVAAPASGPGGSGRLARRPARPGRRLHCRLVRAPTLLIVGGDDEGVIRLNESALARLAAPIKQLMIVPGASHLFEEPGKLEEVARVATDWFLGHLAPPAEHKGGGHALP